MSDPVDFGCDYCRDEQNRSYGHVFQIGDNEQGMILLRCPRCNALYENTPEGPDVTRRLTEPEAAEGFPGFDRFHEARCVMGRYERDRRD